MDQMLKPSDEEVIQANRVRKPRRLRGWLWTIAVLAAGGGIAWWLYTRPAPPERASRRAGADAEVAVRVAPVVRGDIPVSIGALGTVTTLATVTVKTQISGKLTEVGFEEGQAVKKGDFIAQIDPQPYQAALDNAKGQLARDEAMLANAKIDLDRFVTLNAQDSIARQQVDTQRALVKQDEAIVVSDKAAVRTAEINLNYCRIISPIDGRVGLRLVDPGNYVQPSDANGMVIIAQLQPISVIFAVPQDTIPQFITKLRSGVSMPALAFDRNETTQLAAGTLSTVDNQIDTTTGTLRLRATFPNEKELLFPNQFVNVKLIVDTLQNVTIVPSAAVQLGAPGSYVYIAKPDNTVALQKVKVGPADGERVAVLEGLSEGDKVVIDGIDRLKDGAKIRIPGANGASAPAGSAPVGSAPAGAASQGDHSNHKRGQQ